MLWTLLRSNKICLSQNMRDQRYLCTLNGLEIRVIYLTGDDNWLQDVLFRWSSSDTYIEVFKELTKNGNMIEVGVREYMFYFNTMQCIVSDTELNLPMRDVCKIREAALAEGTQCNLMVLWEAFILSCVYFKLDPVPVSLVTLQLYIYSLWVENLNVCKALKTVYMVWNYFIYI